MAIFCALLLGWISAIASVPASEWRSVERPPFQVIFQDSNRSEAMSLASRAPDLLDDLIRDLGLPAPERVTVRILPPGEEGAEGGPPHWAVGYVPGGSTEVVLRGSFIRSYPFEDLLSLFGHELTHVLLNTLPPRTGGLPRWFHEGVAVAESRRWSLRDAFNFGTSVLISAPVPLSRLSRSFPEEAGGARAAYAESFSFINYLEREHGPGVVRRILAGMAGGARFPEAFRAAVGSDLSEVETAWRSKVTFAYRWVPALTSTGALWMGITILVLMGRIARRRKERAIQDAWDREGLS